MYAWRTLAKHPARTCLTIGGIALCVVLVMFLLGVYHGVAEGSIAYVRDTPGDLWVLQGHVTNILRGSSLLTTAHGRVLSAIPGVRRSSPVLFILVSATTADGPSTLYLTGFDPAAGAGGPPSIVEGRTVRTDDEIVVDHVFASMHHLSIGDRIAVRTDTLTVVGKSTGTNAFVVQFAFSTLRRTQSIVGFPSLVSCFIVDVDSGARPKTVRDAIIDELPSLGVFDHEHFLENNLREMESGFLPILYAVAVLGAVVLTAILTLLLTVLILEARKDISVMRALGASDRMVSALLVEEACLLVAGSLTVGCIVYPGLVSALEFMSPVVEVRFASGHLMVVGGIVGGAVAASCAVASRQLRHIHPLEAMS
jgi:putative ABC transport system permease protein